MTALPRWAALASAIGALLIGLPTVARADTSPTEASPTIGVAPGAPGFPGIPGFNCATPTPGNSTSTTVTTGTTTPSTPATATSAPPAGTPTSGTTPSASSPSTSPALNGTPSFPVGTTPTAGGIASPPLPCIDAAGNVYVIYVITVTTTTTTTPISAPILAANGSLSVIGNPASGFATPAIPATKFGSTSAAKAGKSGAGKRKLICVAPTSKRAGTHASRPTNKRGTPARSTVHLTFACRRV